MPNDWEAALLSYLQAPDTPSNRKLLSTWQRWEGGHTNNDAAFNWLNTTRGKQYPGINSVGVRRFPNFQTGISQLGDTITSGRYQDLVAGLRDGNPYDNAIQDDLSVWLSGQPNSPAGARYAAKVMGGTYTPTQRVTPPKPKAKMAVPVQQQAAGPSLDPRQEMLLGFLSARGKNPALLASMASRLSTQTGQAPDIPAQARQVQQTKQAPQPTVRGKVLIPGTSWKGTHTTDNMGWGHNTAQDIMSKAGTPVGAPDDGVIERWGSAQGGEALYLRADNGRVYWLGHIDNRLPVGTRVRRGQVIAAISADHDNPHLHIDYQS